MRFLKTLIGILLISGTLSAQYVQPMRFSNYSFTEQVNIGVGTVRVTDPSAYLEVGPSSLANKGMIIPRLTTALRDAIPFPAAGNVIYNTTTGLINYYDGVNWIAMSRAAQTSWLLTGNTGTVPGTNFLGTTDSVSLMFKVNNATAGLIDVTGLENTSLGRRSAFSNTTGYRNTSFGFSALYSNSVNIDNTAIGWKALYANTSYANTGVGARSLASNTSGDNNTATGSGSLTSNTTGFKNTATGADAMQSNTSGWYNTATGSDAMYFTTSGKNNTADGYSALQNTTTGNNNIGVGYMAGKYNTTGSNQFFINSLDRTNYTGDTSYSPIFIQQNATASNQRIKLAGKIIAPYLPAGASTDSLLSYDASTGSVNYIKPSSLAWSLTGNAGTVPGTNFIGTSDSTDLLFKVANKNSGYIGRNDSYYYNNTFFGYGAGEATIARQANGILTRNTAFGYKALSQNQSNTNVAIGNGSQLAATNEENVSVGNGTLYSATSHRNAAVGTSALRFQTGGSGENTAMGNYCMMNNRTGPFNVAIGSSALRGNVKGTSNVAIGNIALTQNTTSISTITVTNGGSGYTTATVVISAPNVGYDPNNNALQATATATINAGVITAINITEPGKGYTDVTDGYNTAVTATITGDGAGATLSVQLTSGDNNTALGIGAYSYNRTGKYNTGLGMGAGVFNLYGNNNTAVGYYAGASALGSGNVFLGYQAGYNETGSNKLYIANSNTATPLIYGDFATDRIGLGTASPDTKLHVVGSIKMVDGNQGANKVLVSDANGVGAWTASNTANFGLLFGRTDSVNNSADDLYFNGKGYNIVLDSAKVGIGTITPDSLLTVEHGIWGKRGVRFSGLPSGASTDSILTWVTSTGQLKYRNAANLSNWTKNGNDIYNSNSGEVGINTSSPVANLHINGSIATKTRQISATDTLLVTDRTIEVTSGTFTFTLLGASTYTDLEFQIVNIGAGDVTIATSNSEQFKNKNGTPTTLSLNSAMPGGKSAYSIKSNGSYWLVTSEVAY